MWCPIGHDGLQKRVQRLDLQAIRDLIAIHTGERFTPQKGLYWSTTELEGYLATTDTPWPGDADLVLVALDTGLPKAIVEFRKQTQDRGLTSRFSEYYPRPDGRRWDRLAVLASHFEPVPPLLAIHYSVVATEREVLLVRIEGQPGALSETSEVRYEVPTSSSGRRAFTETIVQLI